MQLRDLSITDCRVIESSKLALSPHINIITGKNASGKTSVLEALSILAFGRSFRSSRITDIIRYDKASLIVSALLSDSDDIDKNSVQIGVEKSRTETRIRINKETIKSQSELSKKLPLTIMHPTSYELITGASSLRRRYIDWIAFYLYPNFHGCWVRYNSILKQRNAALKQRKQSYAIDYLTKQLCQLQPQVYEFRQQALVQLKQTIETAGPDFLKSITPDLFVTSGYPAEVKVMTDDLYDFHQTKQQIEKQRGRTLYGAHLSNLEITVDSIAVSKFASRGQIKLITLLLLISQSLTLEKPGIIAIDDFDSELDEYNQSQLILYLASLDQQLFITTTKPALYEKFKGFDSSMFHVKHGVIEKTAK